LPTSFSTSSFSNSAFAIVGGGGVANVSFSHPPSSFFLQV
jgi:hypothetical protein